MNAAAQFVYTRVSHRVRTAQVRDDLIGWVLSGHKRLLTPQGEQRFDSGAVFLLPRGTQWDMFNEALAGGVYEARMISCPQELIERFHQRFGQFAALAPVQRSACSSADAAFAASFNHAMSALQDERASAALREHRVQEVLLLLAERGLVFSSHTPLRWQDRIHRLVSQRPHAPWDVQTIAAAFHCSASTLQRRLAEEGSSVSRCVRELRLEAGLALLQAGQLRVSEIAARCGYDSHSRFSAAFRAHFGFAPSTLRPEPS
ncbi:helix-turn-helix transcriptional regulator [Paucibacter sp. APW11]|uniref:Helix-turn-helix transcriptional regulator n=1 Tax=Roseateles aquae TaxID=3077235 RepID=A0ABU3PGB3_9BURK|nr:helix-turn-helix transcriptional regulator [Paucibacter sp. APW11]MDT9001635.1 helix-turn-helix transcriptional regulator [Paucibacter sp. APW11]